MSKHKDSDVLLFCGKLFYEEP